jgi:hypothetical protein
MKFMLLLKGPRTAEGAAPTPELITAMDAFNSALQDAGAWVDAEGLRPTAEGFRVVNDGGSITVTEGPFTDGDEVVFGYWVIEAASRDEAVAWAQKVPFEAGDSETGTVEVRQIFGLEDFPVQESEGEEGWREQEEQMRAAEPPARKEGARRYFMTFLATPASEAGEMGDEAVFTEMGNFIAELSDAGIFLSGEGLHPSSNASRVRYAGGKRTVTDGPFAETKELIAGYCVVQVDSVEQAKDVAIRAGKINGNGTGEARLAFS